MCSDLLCVVAADLFVTVVYRQLSLWTWAGSLAVAFAVPVLVMLSLALAHAWDPRILGSGSEELRRVGRAYVWVIAGMALAGYALGTANGHSWVFGALPLAAALTLLGRYVLRRELRRRRRSGESLRSVLVAGEIDEVLELIKRTPDISQAGWRVDAVCLADVRPGEQLPLAVDDTPVIGTEKDIVGITRLHSFQAIAVLPSSGWTPARTERLSWELEGTGTDLLIAPVLMDVVGPRLHIAPVAGVPLMQLSAPTYSGPAWVIKNVLDRIFALVLVVAIAPVLLVIAGAICASSRGPALFTQTRVGRDGQLFTMYKFRSMVVGAEGRARELAALDQGAGVLFKIRDDPRVTRVGKFIRRYSLDELPQLFNVVTGSMSLVGPRPPLECEVAQYGDDGARRRLFVKPGLTGLWQVSGRSNLSWEESVRADLHYVENWTFALDVLILWKTIRAVLRPDGAY
ncbi:sugar transferase [Rhodococcus sp. NPDC056960]|uniref:sugar transferase n=1 Tax=Rhodococcus sp. NPDC056960 TaxID=3345982 RepID=UPI0036386B22